MTIEKQPQDASGLNRQSAIGNPQFIEVSAALIFRDNKLLITQRHAKSHLGEFWEFPGGKREAEETFEQCLVREIREELGVEVAVGELFEEISHDYPEKSVHLKFFICQLVSGEPQPLDCAAVKWIEKAELAAHKFPAADARLLEKLKSSFNGPASICL
ncbi:MAG TPA: 8-oxo-dGTP diphosphatase MutT [Verrucomicrobiae bacterium]